MNEMVGFAMRQRCQDLGAVVGADIDDIAAAVVVDALGEREVKARADRGPRSHRRAEEQTARFGAVDRHHKDPP